MGWGVHKVHGEARAVFRVTNNKSIKQNILRGPVLKGKKR